ncbi:MAG TPA: hypothetical protein VGW74_02535 [Propionibacteriaceae bacterium]|nr:hypothetical protein [Propionibacteriaceae bacterium]
MADEVSKSGVFIDAKTGKVVNSQPEEGYQIVPPGGVIDANAQAQIDAAKAAANPDDKAADKAAAAEPAEAPRTRRQ